MRKYIVHMSSEDSVNDVQILAENVNLINFGSENEPSLFYVFPDSSGKSIAIIPESLVSFVESLEPL
jgi:hypothetical protein